jgi:hypothetical protein
MVAGKEVIVACDMGGSLSAKPGATTGFQSQSLKAAYYLKRAGYGDIKHVKVCCLHLRHHCPHPTSSAASCSETCIPPPVHISGESTCVHPLWSQPW